MKKRFVIGDIHGANKALLQCLERSGFDYENDLLISLGDVSDGWSEVPQAFETLLSIKNLIYVLGNHDYWLLDWLKYGADPHIWLSQGGQIVKEVYIKLMEQGAMEVLHRHRDFLDKAPFYHLTEDNKLFVHGGFDWHMPIEEQMYPKDMLWDRHLFSVASMWHNWDKGDCVKLYDEVFIGHTATSYSHPDMKPVHVSNVWNLDQGAGWVGKLTIMDIDSKEYWQSDLVSELYPEEKGRRG